MLWEYRIVKKRDGKFGIHAVYYDRDVNIYTWNKKSIVKPMESFDCLIDIIREINRSDNKDVLYENKSGGLRDTT